MSQRVGILTLHHISNHGAMLQAYAIQEAVRRAGAEPILIDYRPKTARRSHRRFGLRSGRVFTTLIRQWRFNRFLKEHLVLSPRRYNDAAALRAAPPEFDVALVGSDQVWNTSLIHGFDPSFFLDFAQERGARCVSYAPSVGSAKDFGEHRDRIAQLLDGFTHLSARDRRTQSMIQEVSGRAVTHVLDTTFLADFEPLAIPPASPRDYILTYCLARTPVFDRSVAFLRERYDLPVVAISPRHAGYDASANSAGPREWLGYIRRARYVCTNSFHGTVFSLKFGRSFIVPPRSENQTRLDDLLQTVGLTDRVVRDADELPRKDEAFWEIDYSPVRTKLQSEIEKSRNYLQNAVGES